MRSDRGRAWSGGAAFAAVLALTASASDAQTCLSSASSTERASAAETEYRYDSNGHAVDARNVSWLDVPDHVVKLDGSANGCWVGGNIDGPYGETSDVYYECSSEHGWTGGPCLAYHTTAGIAPDEGPRTIEDVHIKDYGDGISVEASSGDIFAKRIWFENLHDDAMETDYAHQSLSCVDCLYEKVWIAMAYRRRSSASGNQPAPGWTIEMRNSLVQLHRFTHAYKEKPGHGSVFKDDDIAPQFIMTNNTFLMGPVHGSGVQLPLLGYVKECAGNTLLWQGTPEAFEDMLDDGDSIDGATNRERLQALSHCYTVVVKPASQSAADFRKERWDPLVAKWKATHAAAGGTPGATTAPTRTPTPTPTATATAPPPTRVPTATPTATAAPTRVPTATPTAVPTRTPTAVPTATPTARPTRTPTPVPTATATPRPSNGPTRTPTPAATPTARPSPTQSPTPAPAPNAPPQEPILLP